MKMLSAVAVALCAGCILAAPALAHPGSGIVVDRLGQIYFVDTGSGLWKIDVNGKLTQIPGSQLHWMTIDEDDLLARVRLPSGSGGEVTRFGVKPTLILASDFPIAIGLDGTLYYPSNSPGVLHIVQLMASGRTTTLADLPATPKGSLSHVNGLAVGPDGFVYYTENSAVRRVSAKGRVSTVVADVVIKSCASIPLMGVDEPLLRGLAVDANGTVYVAASGCGSVLKITSDGRVTTLFQNEAPWSPTGIALFGGNVFVLEYFQTANDSRREWVPRVRKISPDGKTAIIATVSR